MSEMGDDGMWDDQTGWTALVASVAQVYGPVDARTILESGREGLLAQHEANRAHGPSDRGDVTGAS